MISIKRDDFEEPYDPVNFVERVATKCEGGGTKGGADAFDPVKLKEYFEETTKSLQQVMTQTQGRISKLERVCRDQEKQHKANAEAVEKQFKESIEKFHELDDRINFVATKVVHLGDQLENINTPRQRAQEAEQVMKYFEEFHSDKEVSPIFTNPEKIHEAASVICQLSMVAQELPMERFPDVKYRIQERYTAIENDLLLEFKKAYQKGDVEKMANCANTLAPFKRYHQCYEDLISLSISGMFFSADVFQDIIVACEQVQKIITKVFENNAEMIMAQFVQNIFEKKVSGYVYKQLTNKEEDIESYLKTFAELYGKAKEITKKLANFRLGSDSTFLDRLKKSVFHKYSSTYLRDELEYLDARSRSILEKFYASIGHQKREKPDTKSFLPEGFMAEMPASLQDLQRRIPGRTQQILKENLLSQEVAVNLLQENKLAIRRCEMISPQVPEKLEKSFKKFYGRYQDLIEKYQKSVNVMISPPSELPGNVLKIFKLFLKYLGEEHFEYAVDMTIQALPPLEPKSAPDLLFLKILNGANTTFHLMEKHFTDYILRPVGSSPVYSECAQAKKTFIEQLEAKLDQGMERILLSMTGYIKYVLSTEQKKTDFRIDEEDFGPSLHTTACKKSCQYIQSVIPQIRDSLDGKNLEIVLTEFGVRFHKSLLDHLHQFTYTSPGAMAALCDINEYRHTMKLFKRTESDVEDANEPNQIIDIDGKDDEDIGTE